VTGRASSLCFSTDHAVMPLTTPSTLLYTLQFVMAFIIILVTL